MKCDYRIGRIHSGSRGRKREGIKSCCFRVNWTLKLEARKNWGREGRVQQALGQQGRNARQGDTLNKGESCIEQALNKYL